MVAALFGFSVTAIYLTSVIYSYNMLGILHVFPVFAGEDDFSIRRLNSFSVLIPSFVLISWMLSRKFKQGLNACLLSLSGMAISSIIFGIFIELLKSNLYAISERNSANVGVLLYFIVFVVLNLLGFYLGSELSKRN